MKRLSVLIGMAQGLLVLTVSAFAGEGTSLFALNKMSGPTEEVVGLSDNELARVEGSTVPRPPRTVYQSNRVEQRNSATGSQGDVAQENRLVQKNSVSSGSNQLNQSVESYILAAQAAVQRVLQQTFSLSSISPTLESGSATTITGNGGTHTVITVTNQGRTVTVAGGGRSQNRPCATPSLSRHKHRAFRGSISLMSRFHHCHRVPISVARSMGLGRPLEEGRDSR
jgi:hypothetical protein